MKKIEKEYTRVEKEVSYEAWDGETFSDENACREYENNARGVIGKKVQQFLVKRTNEYEFFEPFGVGGEDYAVEVYKPETVKDIESLNLYTNMFNPKTALITDDLIGKEVILFFSYDRDWVRTMTFHDLVKELREHYEEKILGIKKEDKT